jgi:hypothetical protein
MSKHWDQKEDIISMHHEKNDVPPLSELWAALQEQQARIIAQEAEITTLKAKISTRQSDVLSPRRIEEETSLDCHKRRISRATLLKTATASVAGITAIALTGSHMASAAATTTTDTNFVATGSATAAVGFDARPSFANRFIDGVNAQGTNTGVTGTSDNFGVRGLNQGSSYGVGVYGQSTNGDGVIGLASSNNVVAGVKGLGGASAYGGWFESSTGAQLHLTPSSTTGHPTVNNYLAGDIFVDKNVTIWICITSGNPGTWRRIRFV